MMELSNSGWLRFASAPRPFVLQSDGPGGGGVLYLLRDTFTTNRAAGSVNGTAAEPTGGNRVAVDGNNVLSITGGLLSFATGGVGANNPGLWYTSQARVFGRALLGTMALSATAARVIFGFDSASGGLVPEAFLFNTGTTLSIRTNNLSAVSIGIYSATTYNVALVMRSSGMYYFIKGGAFINWTLVFLNTLVSVAGFPVVAADAAAITVFTADNVRIPDSRFIPSPLVYDTFARANGALGSSEIVGPDSQAVPALAWTAATWLIVSNAIVNTPALGADLIVNGAFAADANWTKGVGWTIAAGVATGAVASSDLTAAVAPLTLGMWYQTVFTLSGFAAGTVAVVTGAAVGPTHATNATFTETNLATSTAFVMRGVGFTGNLDNVSAKALALVDLLALVTLSTVNVIWDSTVSVLAAGTQAGLAARWDSTTVPANGLLGYFDGNGNIRLYEVVAGVYTSLLNVVKAFVAGDTLRLDLLGSAWRLYHITAAGVATLQGSGTTNVTTGFLFGNFSTNSGNSVTSCQGFAKGGSETQWNGLNSF